MTETTSIRTSAPPGLSFRRISGADLPFLAEVYASTRREELAQVPWTDADKAAFLRWQFDNQHQYYQQYYPNCEFLIIERQSRGSFEPIGRLYVDRWPDQIRLLDIALVPEFRGCVASWPSLRLTQLVTHRAIYRDMGSHMKTTIEISDALLAATRRAAAREGTTVRQLVEEGLRRVLRERRSAARFKLRKASFKGRGLQAPLSEGQWDRIRELAYEDRGA